MLLGYNTNGLAHHDLLDAIELLSSIGYRSIAITLDHHVLNPFQSGVAEQAARVRDALQQHQMHSVIETGARFLLDPRVKHEPTLMSSPDRQPVRVDFLRRAIDLAAALGSDAVSLWSGILREPLSDEQALERLAAGLRAVLAHAEQRDVRLAFEPEPGMFIDSTAQYERLLQWVDAPHFRLTLDLGHLYCQGEVPIVDYIRRLATRLVNVHIEDMRAGVHEHLMFGEGEMDFPPILAALAEVQYQGPIHVELSRHSHEGPSAAQRAYDFLQPLLAALPDRGARKEGRKM